MIAAIYARKSTDQSGVADEQKSITRQVGAMATEGEGGFAVNDPTIETLVRLASLTPRERVLTLATALAVAAQEHLHNALKDGQAAHDREQADVLHQLRQIVALLEGPPDLELAAQQFDVEGEIEDGDAERLERVLREQRRRLGREDGE